MSRSPRPSALQPRSPVLPAGFSDAETESGKKAVSADAPAGEAQRQDQPSTADLKPLPGPPPTLVPIPESSSQPPKPAAKQGSELTIREVPKPGDSAQETKPPAAPAKRRRPSNKATAPFDPIKENGPIFVDWPKPQAALVMTGRQDGYLEPCGCAGLDRMKGGMSRRYSFFRSLREKGWPVVGLDVGDIAQGFGPQAEIKFQTAVEGMMKTGYAGITLGPTDLRLPAGVLASVVGTPPTSPFISAECRPASASTPR